MVYTDKTYGKINIKEPVIVDLIKSSALQRLRGIDQAGYLFPHFPSTHSRRYRFDHSVGDYILLSKYGVSLEEQIAGLIHDVSHSAFSHCIDYSLDTGSQSKHTHQDSIFQEYVKKTDIPRILKKHGYDIEYILDENNFPLQETELPDLCADRIDYSLRDAVGVLEINQSQVQKILDSLIIKDDQWVFKDYKSARDYAEFFHKMSNMYYAGIESAVMFNSVGETMRYALNKGYINEGDLYTTDKQVLKKIEDYLSKDKRLSLLFARMNNQVAYENNPDNYQFKVTCKSRLVDPLCRDKGKILRVSEVDLQWGRFIKQASKPREYFISYAK